MNLFGVLGISASALAAQRQRAEVVTANLANAETTRTEEGGPYRRKQVVFGPQRPSFRAALAQASAPGRGVQVRAVVEDPSPAVMRYEPGHPDADARGFVAMPNINIHEEMADMIAASHAYEANLAVVRNARAMALQTLAIGTK